MSEPRPQVAAHARTRAKQLATITLSALFFGCSSQEASSADGSFGRGVNEYPRDAGMDGGAELDAAVAGNTQSVQVRFVHALVNLGPLRVCHDPDGTGPLPASPIAQPDGGVLSADFGGRSSTVTLAPLTAGALTLQRVPRVDAGADASVTCPESEREATIPLPSEGSWLDPRDPIDDATLAERDVEKTISGASSLTLFGSGLALDPAALAERAEEARENALIEEPSDPARAAAAADLTQRALQAAYGPRALIQRDPAALGGASTFALFVLHAVPDVAAEMNAPEDTVGAVRLCVTAGDRESTAAARAIPFRYRTQLGAQFWPGVAYHFRVFAQRDFEAAQRDCSTIGAPPIAERRFSAESFSAGHSYTLALLGALAPTSLCSPSADSLVRPGCAHGASELLARIALLED